MAGKYLETGAAGRRWEQKKQNRVRSRELKKLTFRLGCGRRYKGCSPAIMLYSFVNEIKVIDLAIHQSISVSQC